MIWTRDGARLRFLWILAGGWSASGGTAFAFLYGLCYAMTGKVPVHDWPIVIMSLLFGLIRGLEAAGRDYGVTKQASDDRFWWLMLTTFFRKRPPGEA